MEYRTRKIEVASGNPSIIQQSMSNFEGDKDSDGLAAFKRSHTTIHKIANIAADLSIFRRFFVLFCFVLFYFTGLTMTT